MRFLRGLRFFAALVVVVVVASGAAALWFKREVSGPGPLAAPATVIITSGTGLAAIAHQLADAGVIRAGWMFELEARRTGRAKSLKPGEYRFAAQASLTDALTKIVTRDVVARFVTVPEGLVTLHILEVVAAAEGLQGELPVVSEEGALLPETYRYEWGDSRAAVVARMRAAKSAALTQLWAARADNLPLKTPEEAIVLASIVEKETGVPAERARVAAVFINRLRIGMRLQSDPTVAYGLAPTGLNRDLTRADLAAATPYNTYVIDRLPPSPICNPGRAAIAAVLNPDTTSDLYFVADGSGGHAFAATLEDHNRNVARWRRLQTTAP